MATNIYETQAHRICSKLGGATRVAEFLNVTVRRVYRWRHSSDKGGCDGLIPTHHVKNLKLMAELHGVELTAEDWAP